MKKNKNSVVFAGAGPGDPGLITVNAMNALKTANLIIYAGSLVPEAVLCWRGEKTETKSSAGMDLNTIIDTIKTYHERGEKIVRLHTGDPALYGAIHEQMEALEKLNIPYEIIPGVTAAFAASSKMNMEYTLPEITQTLILTRVSGRTPVPESEALEKLAAHQAAMAIYLSIGLIEKVQKVLEKHYGKESLSAIAYKVSHPEEKIIYTKTKNLVKSCEENKITRHALVIAGKCVAAAGGDNDSQSKNILKSKLYDAGFSHGCREKK